MTHFIRTQNNKTILDLECWVKSEYGNDGKHSFVEISASVDIETYSLFLLSIQDPMTQLKFIADMQELSELRGWLWEVYFMVKQNTPEEYGAVREEVRKMLRHVCELYDLIYVED